MTITDKYLFKKITFGFACMLSGLFFLYILIDLFTSIQDFIKLGVSLQTIGKYYLLMMPTIFVLIAPISFLLTSLFILGMLNKTNEMVSLRTQGLSPTGIAAIFIILSLLISVFSLYIDDKVVPRASLKIEAMDIHSEKEDKKDDGKQEIINNFHFYTKSNKLVFARSYNPNTAVLSQVNIFQLNEQGITTEEIISQQIRYVDGEWMAHDATLYLVEDGIVNFEKARQEKTYPLGFYESPKEIMRRAKLKWTDLSLKDIKKQIKNFRQWKASKIIRLLEVEFHRKIAQNFALFFMLLGALPFSLRIQQRKAGVSALLLTIAFCFVYYFLFSLSIALGKSDFFLPAIACWITNIFFGVSGLVGMSYLK